MESKYSICIVTPNYLSSTPRVVKEADALWDAGFDVRVAFTQGNLEWLRQHDEILLAEKPWRWSAVGWSPFREREVWLYRKTKLRFHLARRLPLVLYRYGRLAEYAEGRMYRELARLSVLESADLYIGHYPDGLAAAAYAASHWRAKLGYDVEDLYTEHLDQGEKGVRQRMRVRILEERYLPRCSHVTAASELIADEMTRRYRIARPAAIHNVFPLAERNALDGQIKDRIGSSPSLYWFSRYIGLGRGIEDAIRAASLFKQKVQIHLRGAVSDEVRQPLLALARECGVEKQLYFHPPVPPTELLSRTVEHDVGLALDYPVNLNMKLTVTNKTLFYLVAGLVIAATDIPGQRYVMETCPDAGFLYPPGDYQSLADHLNKLLGDPQQLKLAKQAALRAAQERWSWERESPRLIQAVWHGLERTRG